MSTQEIRDQKITNTVMMHDLLTGQDIGTWQQDYLLREVEFVHIKNGKPLTLNWASGIGLTTVGYGLNLIAKGYKNINTIEHGEWVALALGGVSACVLYVVGRFILTDEKKAVLRKIEQHFKEATPQRRIVGEKNE
ncbi:hypothetical protein [Vibrio mediterranei]|uniref:Uncharacterized protein n=1 Tax=Vibrio mediterranei TaxID=689 RepID=A0ABX5D428_9VIBR|nr:hypothetical protein [Vibrio mediterranei]PRQ64434.1 hypothetical protein COR51_27540 [Vibrio mediterranei]